MSFLLLKLSFWLLFAAAYAERAAELELSGARSGCPRKCGKITIPYPFGIGVKCALSEGLYVTCDSTYNPPRPFLEDYNLQIQGISATEVRIYNYVAFTCYDKAGSITEELTASTTLPEKHYTFSYRKNMFVSVGCDTIAYIQGLHKRQYASGCITLCASKDSIVNRSCSGIGCCHTSIPKRLKYFEAHIGEPNNLDSAPFNLSQCSYSFLAEFKEFRFHASDIGDPSFYNRTMDVPRVIDWVVDNVTCKDANKNLEDFACQSNTFCVDSQNGPGYRCRCKKGYEGNPYLTPGCRDIDECQDSSKNNCLSSRICINLPGSYNCTCPHGTYGDGRQNSTGCIPENKASPENKYFPVSGLTLGVTSGLIFLLAASCLLYLGRQKRRVARLKEKFFKQNGGLLLQQHEISSHEGGVPVKLTKIYTAEELKAATNNYDERRIIGRGGNGTVYKGIFTCDQTETVVAIKKSKIVEETQIEQFINEVVILTQINHRNVVKLLGCCLETEVPLLVYEFISNGTLYEHIHNRPLGAVSSSISWNNRLRIMTETAGALLYLHSAASIPIIHRDIKSANILLDDNYNTKVADFGASRLIPLDQTQISTLVQGTLGYLDPEYFLTGQLTGKSDVYSFGVILVELLTGEKPLSIERAEDRRNLASHFIMSMQENALSQIIEERLMDEGDTDQLFAVAELALRCLNLKGAKRPTMREIVGELEGLRRLFEQHPLVQEQGEEVALLFNEPTLDLYPVPSNPFSCNSGGQSSLNDSMMVPLNLPR